MTNKKIRLNNGRNTLLSAISYSNALYFHVSHFFFTFNPSYKKSFRSSEAFFLLFHHLSLFNQGSLDRKL
jgi:hypothetical protein